MKASLPDQPPDESAPPGPTFRARRMSDLSLADTALLTRIAEALERLAPKPPETIVMGEADAFVWHAESGTLTPVPQVARVDIGLLAGVERQRDLLLANTKRFAAGLPANNVLLWGARGMGKSSLVKAAHAAVNQTATPKLALVEIHREDIHSLPALLRHLRSAERRSILFCDDLSFDVEDTSYKSLKAVLEGGIEGRPENVLFYATSNRRHLLPRDMIDNERSTAINPGDAIDEKVSLSDRFGLWLGFHICDQDVFFRMVDNYADAFGIKLSREELHARAVEWSVTRGHRSGRVAWQFIQDLIGEPGIRQ
jgi:hypothetical protein